MLKQTKLKEYIEFKEIAKRYEYNMNSLEKLMRISKAKPKHKEFRRWRLKPCR